jgi:hypothetical protein
MLYCQRTWEKGFFPAIFAGHKALAGKNFQGFRYISGGIGKGSVRHCFLTDRKRRLFMSVSLPAGVSHPYSAESLTNRIRQRQNAYAELSGVLEAAGARAPNKTFLSLLSSSGASSAAADSRKDEKPFAAAIKALQDAIRSGDKAAIKAANEKLSAEIKNALPVNEQTRTILADLKTLAQAVRAGDKEAIQAANEKLSADIKDALAAYRQALEASRSSAASSLSALMDSDLKAMIAAANAKIQQTAASVQQSLQPFLEALENAPAAPLAGIGATVLSALAHKNIHTSA